MWNTLVFYIKVSLNYLSLVYFNVLTSVPIILDCVGKDCNLIQYGAYTYMYNLDIHGVYSIEIYRTESREQWQISRYIYKVNNVVL